MFSSKPHTLHLESPFHFIFNKLSFVKITPLFRYHRIILIFRGNLAFQNNSFPELLSLFIISLYNDCVEKTPLFPIYQMNLSLLVLRLTITSITKETKVSHSFNISPLNPHLKEIFSGVEPSTLATETFFYYPIQIRKLSH